MTTIQIELPDELAQKAERAGLLSGDSMEQWLRERLRANALAELKAATVRMMALDDTPYMSPEDVADETRAMRDERRTKLAE
jgi:hypothetical protein